MKNTMIIFFLFLNGVIYSQNIDSTQLIKNEFIYDSCGVMGIREKYTGYIVKIIMNKTRSEIISLLGKPNTEYKKSIHYIIKTKKCKALRKTILMIGFDKDGICNEYGFKEY